MIWLIHLARRRFRLLIRREWCHSLIVLLTVQLSVLLQPGALAGAAEPSAGMRGTPATAIAFAPTGEAIVTGTGDGLLMLWDRQTGKLLRQFETEQTEIRVMASSSAAGLVALGGTAGTVELWDVETGKCERTLTESGGAVTALAFSEDGETVASGSEDRTIRLWQVASGKLIGKTRKGEAPIRTLDFSPDGQLLASDGDGWNVRLWKAQTGAFLDSLKGHNAPVVSVSFSADGQYIAASSNEGLLIWETERRKGPSIGVDFPSGALAFSPLLDDLILASVTDDEVWLWNVSQERRGGALKGHIGEVKALDYSPDGTQIISLGSDHTVRLWSVRPNEPLLVINPLTSEAYKPSDSPRVPWGVAGKVETASAAPSGKEPQQVLEPPPSAEPVAQALQADPPEASMSKASPSQLKVAYVSLGETERDGGAQSGDRVNVYVSVVNPGPGTVRKAEAKLALGPGVSLCSGSDDEFDLDKLAPGAVKLLKFSCTLDSSIKNGSRIPVSVIFTSKYHDVSKEEPLDLVLGLPPTQPTQPAEPAGLTGALAPSEKPVLTEEQRRNLAKEYYEKGNLSFEARDYETAASHYCKAIELEDSFAPLFYNLAMAQRALHQDDEAVKHFKRYLALRPDAPNTEEVLQIIKELGE